MQDDATSRTADRERAPLMARLDIHGWHLELRFHGAPGLASRWLQYTATHADKGGAAARVAVVDIELVPGFVNAGPHGAGRLVANGVIELSTPVIRGELTAGEDVLRGRILAQGDHIETLDGIAGLLLAILAGAAGRIVLHSSAVVSDGQAYLFVGDGGAGKTTIAVELGSGRVPVSVDRTLISFSDDGAAWAGSTPLGDRNRDLPGPAACEIAGIFFIEQAARHEVRPVEPFEAARLLLAQTIVPTPDRETVQRAMDAAGRLADRGLCHRLRFARDDGFWPLVEAAVTRRPA